MQKSPEVLLKGYARAWRGKPFLSSSFFLMKSLFWQAPWEGHKVKLELPMQQRSPAALPSQFPTHAPRTLRWSQTLLPLNPSQGSCLGMRSQPTSSQTLSSTSHPKSLVDDEEASKRKAAMWIRAFVTFMSHSLTQKQDFSGKYERCIWKRLCMSSTHAEQ